MSEKVIEINNLSKKFKDILAVNGLSLNVFEGDVFGFLGPNGAGKSTTIRMMLSLIFPTAGDIKIFGKSITSHRTEIFKNIGAIVEKPDFYGYLSAFNNLEILGKISRINPDKNKIYEILELVGLKERAHSKVKTFSHGMKQRLGLAQALIHDPKLIILDEPTTGLDPQGMKEIRDLIIYLSKDKNKTIFLSSHILHEVELIATRMVIINKGKTIIEGNVNSLLDAAHLKVQFNVSDPDKALSLINENSYVDKMDVPAGNNLILFMNQDKIALLNRLFVENGIEVSSIVPTRSLEEYFLSLMEKN